MLENPISNMFKHEGKIVTIIGKSRIKTYKELYDYLEDLIDVPFLTKGESVRLNTCCDSPFIVKEGGCTSCKACGWSKCHIS